MRPARLPDDASLLQRCRKRDERAWRQLVSRYEDLVFVTARRTGLGDDAALDVFQQVWLELHRSLHRIRNPRALPRWLMVTTRRLAWREAGVRKESIEELEEDLVDPRALADEEVAQMEQSSRLHAALRRLGEPCAGLLRMLLLLPEPTPYRTIARRTGLAVGSIGSARARCLRRLRVFLETAP